MYHPNVSMFLNCYSRSILFLHYLNLHPYCWLSIVVGECVAVGAAGGGDDVGHCGVSF